MLFAAPVLWLLFGKDPGASDAGSQKAGGEDAEAMKSSAAAAAAAHPRAPLPLTYWIYWVLILLVEAVEFLILLWGADYLEKVSGLSKANAALGMSAFMGSMLVGRALVSRLLRRSQEQRLVLGSLLLSTAGFLLFWLSPGPLPAIFGLLVAGLGVAGQFPILNSLALSSVPGRMVEGSGRITLAVGLAILLLPLLLGRLADWVGIRPAYGLELVLLVTAIGLMLWLGKRKKQGKVTL
jgi:fucose permease